jgi:hypothetical protein
LQSTCAPATPRKLASKIVANLLRLFIYLHLACRTIPALTTTWAGPQRFSAGKLFDHLVGADE